MFASIRIERFVDIHPRASLKKTLMLLVLLLSLCKSFQISPFRIAHECFILESGCKSTHFPGNFQMFSEKSLIFKRNLIYVKPKTAFHKERAPPPAPWTSARLTEPRAPQGGWRRRKARRWQASNMLLKGKPHAMDGRTHCHCAGLPSRDLFPYPSKKKKKYDDVSRTHVRRRIISIVSIISIISIISIYRSHAWLSSS